MRFGYKKILKNGILQNTLNSLTLFIIFLIFLIFINSENDNPLKAFLGMSTSNTKVIVEAFPTPTPTQTPLPLPTSTPTPAPKPAPNTFESSQSQWGVATQLTQHTWTLNVGQDEKMATPQEILIALNNYRQNHGAGALSWSDSLGSFAQSRANSFNSAGKLDEHAGFFSYLDNPDNQKQIGFLNLGENSSIGYNLEAVHLIEWVYASDEGHNKNQLNTKWTHVGIGVSKTATDLVFGG